jgi:hypothetical protein
MKTKETNYWLLKQYVLQTYYEVEKFLAVFCDYQANIMLKRYSSVEATPKQFDATHNLV